MSDMDNPEVQDDLFAGFYEAPPEDSLLPSEEIKSRGWIRKIGTAALVAAAAGSLVFEQSPANEALRINVGLDVLQRTQNALAVGGTIALLTAGIEMTSATLITLGLHSENGLIQRIKQRKKNEEILKQEDPEKIKSGLASMGADAAIALGIGAGLVTVKHHAKDSDPTIAKDLATSAKATAVVAGVSGLIGYLAAGGIANAEKVGLGTPAEYVVDYGTDTKFWMTALGIGYGIAYAKKGINKLRENIQSKRIENVSDYPIVNG